jgi:membrane protease YdiL (CAAX protease family)
LRFTLNETAGSTAIIITFCTSFIIFAFGAAFEEVLMRGYIFQTFVRANLIWVAIILTSFLFASGHLGNPNSAALPFINTF